MKYSITFLLFILFVCMSCGDDDMSDTSCEACEFTCLDNNETNVFRNDCLDNYECQYSIYAQSEVDTNKVLGYTTGGKSVFFMRNYTEGDIAIADDEFTNNLVFELQPFQTNFSVEDEELTNLNTHFQRICYCAETDFNAINSGCMQGEQQEDGTWFVQGSLFVPYMSGDIEIKFDAKFTN